MKLEKLVGLAFLVSFVSVAQGCGAAGITMPTLAPIVKAALPSGLSASGAAIAANQKIPYDRQLPSGEHILIATPGPTPTPSLASNAAPGNVINANADWAAVYINNLFQDQFTKFGATAVNVSGVMNWLVGSVDDRMANVGSISGSCLTATAVPYTVDLTGVDPVLAITLTNPTCSTAMTSNVTGSGVITGNSGANYSLWMSLGAQGSGTINTNGGFFIYANLKNYNTGATTSLSAHQVVDGLAINWNPTSTPTASSRQTISRFIADQTAGTFELWMSATTGNIAASQAATGNMPTCVGAGFRMISDGTNIYADGFLTGNGVTGCSEPWVPFMACLSAKSLAINGTANETTMSTSGGGTCNTLSTAWQLPGEAATALKAEAAGGAGSGTSKTTETSTATLATAEGTATSFTATNTSTNSGLGATAGNILQAAESSGCTGANENTSGNACAINGAIPPAAVSSFNTAMGLIAPISVVTSATTAGSSGH